MSIMKLRMLDENMSQIELRREKEISGSQGPKKNRSFRARHMNWKYLVMQACITLEMFGLQKKALGIAMGIGKWEQYCMIQGRRSFDFWSLLRVCTMRDETRYSTTIKHL